MLEYIKNAHPEIIDELNETKALSDELGDKILAAAKEYVK
jgi:F-type H+-transporting ATPase subunit alpha